MTISQQMQTQIDEVNRRINFHAKRRMVQLTVGTILAGSALFVVVRYLYLNFFWH